MKTYKRNPGRTEYDQVHGKVFINVCSHEEIDPPLSTPVTGPDGRQGESWSMPHLVSPKVNKSDCTSHSPNPTPPNPIPHHTTHKHHTLRTPHSTHHPPTTKARDEKDKADHVCTAVDICFHIDVLKRCDANGEAPKPHVASQTIPRHATTHNNTA